MRYTLNTYEQYEEAWKHCMRIGITFYYHREEFWVESPEFDELDAQFFKELLK